MLFKRLALAILLVMAWAGSAFSQITVPNTFSPNTRAQSAQVNDNFTTLGSQSLNRQTGGTITGNITVSPGITFDGVDVGNWLGQNVSASASPAFAGLTINGNSMFFGTMFLNSTLAVVGNTVLGAGLAVTSPALFHNTGAAAIGVAGGITAGTSVGLGVPIIGTDGRIPAINSTFFANVSGVNLTGVGLLGSINAWTERQDLDRYSEEQATATHSSGGGTITVNLNSGTHHSITLNASAGDVNFTNEVTSGRASSVTLQILYTSGTAHTITWGSEVKWAGGSPPALTCINGRSDFFSFLTYDGGTTWYGFVGGQNFF